jgi:hypothetical protein
MDPTEIPLRDIHLPGPISWWPPATGWTITAGLLVLAAAIGLIVWYRYRRRRVQRAALNELSAIEHRYREHSDTHRLAGELSRLTRRTSLALDPERNSAAATGAEWSTHLDEMSESGVADDLIKAALLRAPYRPEETLEGDRLLAAFRPWLAGLRAPRGANK